MNKYTKTTWNYILGILISSSLLIYLFYKIKSKYTSIPSFSELNRGNNNYLWICFLLMLLNITLETFKWWLLVRQVEKKPFFTIFCSYTAGMAFAILTPNRIGEYPARLIYLNSKKTLGYIKVSLLGILSQLLTILIFGFISALHYKSILYKILQHYNFHNIIIYTLSILIFVAILILWNYKYLFQFLQQNKKFKRLYLYGRLMKKLTIKTILLVGIVSVFRYLVYSAQYLYLMRWLQIPVSLSEGFGMLSLFFLIITIIPTVVLGEVGIRGYVGLLLFGQFTTNNLSIVAATTGIWMMNVIFPAIIGSLLMVKIKLFR